MNERIRELAEQAWDSTQDNVGHFIDEGGKVNWDFFHIYDKKFAELIVKECANKLRETDYELVFVEDGMCDPSISDAMLVAASDIEEHFGVE